MTAPRGRAQLGVGHARSAYGITEDALVLVGPDTYVGPTARVTDHGAFAGHLDSAINVPLRLAAHPAVGID
ncbi:hypothetical protein [Streptomyces sp. NPDC051286]|uniref:hypothetical protein n=1 Tax=Streptomyces sp. NPDC051286 TaxID=3365647 RepID=UPI0037B1DF9B